MILHIFRKDARRLWPHASVTLVLLASLAWHDRWRSDTMVGSIEGWLNLLLPLAWTCLIGLVMEQEPLVGDRQFWITRPYRRMDLLAAKALFALVFIHLPYLLGACYILAFRGFSPAASLPYLLRDQLLIAAALTLPAMALASLVRSFTHFILEIVAVAAAAIFLSGSFQQGPPVTPVDAIRWGLTILVAAAVSAILLAVQYSRRRLAVARTLAIAGGVCAAIVFGYLMPRTAFAVRSAINPAPGELSLRISLSQYPHPARMANGRMDRPLVALPISPGGLPAGVDTRYYSLMTEIATPAGERLRFTAPADYRVNRRIDFDAYIASTSWESISTQWLHLRIDRARYRQLKDKPVKISGETGVTLYRPGETTWMPVGAVQNAGRMGRCSSTVLEGRYSERSHLKVECETPSGPRPYTQVRVWHPETGEEFKTLTGFATFFPGPRMAWLSPLYRVQAFFNILNEPRQHDARFEIPAAYLRTAMIAITPEELIGYSVVRYEFSGVSLDQYVVAQ